MPDVAVVMRGTFNEGPRQPDYPCALLIGDRNDHSAYSMELSDDCAGMVEKLKSDRVRGAERGPDD